MHYYTKKKYLPRLLFPSAEMSLTYLNAIFGMETQKIQEMLNDIDINVYETLYAPFYSLSGECQVYSSSEMDFCDGPLLICSYLSDEPATNLCDFSEFLD